MVNCLEMCCLIKRSFLATLGCVDVCLGWWLKLRLQAARNATTPPVARTTIIANNCQQGLKFFICVTSRVRAFELCSICIRQVFAQEKQCKASSKERRSPTVSPRPAFLSPAAKPPFSSVFKPFRDNNNSNNHAMLFELSAGDKISLLSSSG
jgi:hypothetical protein